MPEVGRQTWRSDYGERMLSEPGDNVADIATTTQTAATRARFLLTVLIMDHAGTSSMGIMSWISRTGASARLGVGGGGAYSRPRAAMSSSVT